MLSRLQSLLDQGEVGIRGGGHNHHVDRGVVDQLVGGPVGLDTGVVLLSIVAGLGATLNNRVELQLGNLLHEGDVENLGAEAVADHADVVGLGGHDVTGWGDCRGWEMEKGGLRET